jgi:prepilin-type N-terminal cleavage/methylation domain-containing protein
MIRLKHSGFTMIEVIIFIIVSGILASVAVSAMQIFLNNSNNIRQGYTAELIARECIEGYIGERNVYGYATFTCPSTTVLPYCTTQTGYNISVNLVCSTFNTDTNYQTLTVTVSGLGNATLTTLFGLF